MYITYNKNTKIVIGEPSEKSSVFITDGLAICEVEKENIPQEYDYLLVDNIRVETRVVKEAYTEEVVEWNEETQTEETKLVEHEQETETYFTCDLIAKFREYTAEQIEKQKEKRYHDLTSKYIRQKYPQDKMESVINNYLEYRINYEDVSALTEYEKMQAYRKECKGKAHKEVYGV